jgi:TPR repeat protein
MVTDKLYGVCPTGVTDKAEIPQNIVYYPFIGDSLSVINMCDIFLSYSTEDRERLMPLVSALEQHGWAVFWDHRSVPIGEKWREVIEEAVCQCSCVLVVWSQASVKSRWVTEEASEGSRRGVLLPIRVDDILPPFGFREDQAGNFIGWDETTDYPEFIRLADRVRLLLDEQAQREAEAAAKQERLAQEKAAVEQQARAAAEQQRRLEAEAPQQRETAEAAERERLAKEKAAADQKAREAADRQRWLDESQARLAAEEAAKQKKLAQERAAEQKAREEAERQAKAKQDKIKREQAAAEEKARKEAARQANVNPDLPPKKFPWLPALFISAAIFSGGGYYWQAVGKSPVGTSPAGDSPVQQTNPVKEESLAGQAPTAVPQAATVVEAPPPVTPPTPPEPTPAERIQQAKAWLNGEDEANMLKAVNLLQPLADANNGEAERWLGAAYYYGLGVTRNRLKGCTFYKDALKTGHVDAETVKPLCPK